MASNYMRKIENFRRTVKNLRDAMKEHYPPLTDFELTGIVAHYNLCYECSWKAARSFLIETGVSKDLLSTPRNVLRSAYRHGLISDELIWVEILRSRNEGIHLYDHEKATELVENIKSKYLEAFETLNKNLKAV